MFPNMPKRLPLLSLLIAWALAVSAEDAAMAPRADSPEKGAETGSTGDATVPLAAPSTPASIAGKTGHAGPNPHNRLTPEQHIAVALQHVEAGRIELALDVLSRAIDQSPGHAGLLGARGGLLLGENEPSKALVDLEKAVQLAPNSALLLVNRSQAYRRFNRLSEALDDLNTAVELAPKLVPARFNRGVLLFGEARYAEALADFDRCISLAPEVAGPYFNRAVTRDALGDKTGAVADLNHFLEVTDNPEWQQAARDTLEAWQRRETAAATDPS